MEGKLVQYKLINSLANMKALLWSRWNRVLFLCFVDEICLACTKAILQNSNLNYESYAKMRKINLLALEKYVVWVLGWVLFWVAYCCIFCIVKLWPLIFWYSQGVLNESVSKWVSLLKVFLLFFETILNQKLGLTSS